MSRRLPITDEHMLDREGVRDREEYWTAESDSAVLACAHYRASQVGGDVLRAGGNAVDAAVAASFALSVVESAGSGLGGMATMMVHPAGARRPVVLSGACRAPRRATPEEAARSPRYTGYRAVAVPMYVSVMDAALRRFGTRSASELLAPAIGLAERGFPLTSQQSALIGEYRDNLARGHAAGLFLDAAGGVPPPGASFVQPALARTLRRLSRAGLRDFYEGDIARRIVADMERNEGFIGTDDLAAVGDPPELVPESTVFRRDTVYAAGAPAGGRTLLEMLNLWTELAPSDLDVDGPGGVALLAAIVHRARRDRRTHRFEGPEDPDYGSRGYAREIAGQLREEVGLGETSHLVAIDAAGNAVSLTQSIERSFGAAVAAPDLGFLFNGYMKGFKVRAVKHPHYLRPGAVARSNAAPTIALRDGRPTLAVGSTGSERMASGIFQVLARLAGQSPFEAVHAPRLHATPRRVVLAEVDRFRPESLSRLQARGYRLQRLDPYSFKVGGLHLAVRRAGRLVAVAEPRRDGAAVGL